MKKIEFLANRLNAIHTLVLVVKFKKIFMQLILCINFFKRFLKLKDRNLNIQIYATSIST